MDIRGELDAIIATSGFSRAKLTLLLRSMVQEEERTTRVKKAPAPPCTKYTEIRKNTTCLHCGAKYSTTLQLLKGEDTAVVTKEGTVMIINAASPAKVECATSYCSFCTSFIKKMSREELELRYTALLSTVSLVGKGDVFGNLISKDGREKI